MGQLAFDRLQSRLRPLWETISRLNDFEQTIVVVPSLSLDKEQLQKIGPQVVFYEERMLFLLLLLRQPRARVVFVSSVPIDEKSVDYLLSLMPGVIPSQARRRLFLVSAEDASLEPLAGKILDDKRLLGRIRELIADPQRAHLVAYITTELERDVALALGIPMYGCDPRLSHIGTKSGAKRIFREAGVAHPAGLTDLHTVDELISAAVDLSNGKVGSFLVKLDEGVSGLGNAHLDLSGLAGASRGAVEDAVRSLNPEGGANADEYLREFDAQGGVIEELIVGSNFRSPSVQLRVTPLGEVEVLSTHDQLLGGPTGQVYLGCVFPADPAYASDITRSAVKVGEIVAREGVLGRFAIDFVATQRDGGWDHYAVEINLRKGGTTHPYLTLQFLTDGRYDTDAAEFLTPDGKTRTLVASDHATLAAPIELDELFDRAVVNGLHFDNSRQVGVVFHMLGAVERHGVVGLTSVGETREEARRTFDRTLELLGATL